MCLHPSSMREHREKIHVICNDTTIIHGMSEICLAFLDGAPFKLTLRGWTPIISWRVQRPDTVGTALTQRVKRKLHKHIESANKCKCVG